MLSGLGLAGRPAAGPGSDLEFFTKDHLKGILEQVSLIGPIIFLLFRMSRDPSPGMWFVAPLPRLMVAQVLPPQ